MLGFFKYDSQKMNADTDDEYEIDEEAEYFEKHKEEIAKAFQKDGDEDIPVEYIIEFLPAELWTFYKKEYL